MKIEFTNKPSYGAVQMYRPYGGEWTDNITAAIEIAAANDTHVEIKFFNFEELAELKGSQNEGD